jgi:hypothetical protein
MLSHASHGSTSSLSLVVDLAQVETGLASVESDR